MRTITEKKVRQVLAEIIDENPRRKNPTARGGCVYTSPKNPAKHCIAGEVLSRIGFPLPGVDERLNARGIWTMFNERGLLDKIQPKALNLLSQAQNRADEGRAWGSKAIREVLA